MEFMNQAHEQIQTELRETVKQLQAQVQQLQAEAILKADNWVDKMFHESTVAQLKAEALDDRVKLTERIQIAEERVSELEEDKRVLEKEMEKVKNEGLSRLALMQEHAQKKETED